MCQQKIAQTNCWMFLPTAADQICEDHFRKENKARTSGLKSQPEPEKVPPLHFNESFDKSTQSQPFSLKF